MKFSFLPIFMFLSYTISAQFTITFLPTGPQTAAQPIVVQNNPPYTGMELFSAKVVGSTYFNPNNLGYTESRWGDDIQIPNSVIGTSTTSADIKQVRLGLYREANAPSTKVDLYYGSIDNSNSFTPVTRFAVFDLPANNSANNVVEVLTVGDNVSTIFNVPLSDVFTNKKTFSLGMSISNGGANGWLLQNGASTANANALVRYDTMANTIAFVTFPIFVSPNACFYSEVFGQAAIPVTLRDFSGNILRGIKNTARLVWQTESEHLNAGFDIEKSMDGQHFTKIGFTKGLGSTGGDYSFTDDNFVGKTYYRLKQIDEDGSFSYSKTIALSENGKGTTLEVYPNPSSDGRFAIKSGELPTGLQIINTQGQVIEQKNTPLSKDAQIDLSTQPSGVYWLKTTDGQVTKVIKN
ncbi:MAG: T9SS type A sorting domain-containing protein [Saprospiraceae bacterium]|nr:T9SS type A sorting domain-containing protein [Saprospiraceae bacterium]